MIKTHHDLEVYQRAYHQWLSVYRIASQFNESQQLLGRRLVNASYQILVCLVEALSLRQFDRDLKEYLRQALGFCEEAKICLNTAHDLDFITSDQHSALDSEFLIISKQLYSLRKNWGAKKKAATTEDKAK